MSDASADELFRDLRLLIERGDLRLELDLVRLDHIDSPVAVEADSNVWVYGLILVCVAAFWQGGTWPGVAAIGMSLLLYFTVARLCAPPIEPPRPRAGARRWRCLASALALRRSHAGRPWRRALRCARRQLDGTGAQPCAASNRTSWLKSGMIVRERSVPKSCTFQYFGEN